MDLPHALAADLRDLSLDLSGGGYTATIVEMLDRDLRRSVPSALGLSITLEVGTHPGRAIRVNFVPRIVEPHEIVTALTIPLIRLAPPLTGQVVFYAGQSGAFAHLAAGLAKTLHAGPGEIDQQAMLPSTPVTPSIEGLQDFSVVNRALGVLLNRGHTLPAARSELRLRAKDAHIDLTTAAHAILRSAYYETS